MTSTATLNDLALQYLFGQPEAIPWSRTTTPDGDVRRARFSLSTADGVATVADVEYQHRTINNYDCDCCGDGYRFSLKVKTDEEITLLESDARLRVLTKNYFHLPLNRAACVDGRWVFYEHDCLTPKRERVSVLGKIAYFFSKAA